MRNKIILSIIKPLNWFVIMIGLLCSISFLFWFVQLIVYYSNKERTRFFNNKDFFRVAWWFGIICLFSILLFI